MKLQLRTLGLIVILALATGGAGIAAQEDPDGAPIRVSRDRISVFGDEIYIPADTTVRGSVLCIGGKAVIEGRVTQDVVVVLGKLELRGEVRGSVIGAVSELDLDGAQVGDLLLNAAGKMHKSDTVAGQEMNFGLGNWFPGFGSLLFWLRSLRLIVVFVTLVLLAALVPDRIRMVSEEAPVRYLSAFFVGLLGYLALWAALVLLSVTLIGAVAAWFLFQILKWMCIAGIFYAVGKGLGRAMGREISILGGVLLSFALYALVLLLLAPLGFPGLLASWVFGMFFALMVKVPAVGLLILTRAGTRPSGMRVVPRAAAAAPPAGPPPPTGPAGG